MQVSRRRVFKGLLTTAFVAAAPRILRAQTIRAYNLVPGGLLDNWTEFNELLKEVEKRGRGHIEIPPGIFLVTPRDKKPALVLPANTALIGSGRTQTTILIGPGVTGHGINATFGYAQVSDLTIDGNGDLREGMVGHNIRIGGEKVTIERVVSANSPSYGLAISQRNYARGIVIRDVEVRNAGGDGIDIKNRIARTTDVLLENVIVKGFGKPIGHLDKSLLGTNADNRRNRAAVDLRGLCEVRNLLIEGILPNRDGLRFRPGELGAKGHYGAHGSKASGIRIRADSRASAVNGIVVVARDVTLSDIDIDGADYGLTATAENLKVYGGIVRDSQFALKTRRTTHGKPGHLLIKDVAFVNSGLYITDTNPIATFENCSFVNCRQPAEPLLMQTKSNLDRNSFDDSCRM